MTSPYLIWGGVRSGSGFAWPAPRVTPQAGIQVPAITIPHGAGGPTPVGGQLNPNAIGASVFVTGNPIPGQGGQQINFTAQTNAPGGSIAPNLLQPVSSLAGLYPGQLVAQAQPWSGGWWVPNDLEIVALGTGPPAWVQISGNALATTLSVPFVATDWLPTGTLAVTVTPGTGVQMVDYNFDGTTNSQTQGSATLISNYSGEADGGFYISFANTGSYSVSVAFTTGDTNYSSATIQYPLQVTVT